MDVASGLHNLLRDDIDLVETASLCEQELHDVRIPSVKYPIANGIRRTGKRCLAVGTDCSVGKMYTALCMEKDMRERNMKATFRATGQTGILITGDGVPLGRRHCRLYGGSGGMADGLTMMTITGI